VDFTFGPEKDAINIARHGVSLAFGTTVFEDADRVLLSSFREIDGEHRYKAIGLVEGKLWTAVHVMRGGVVRFISVRRSNNGEERAYRAAG
jgi:uncharacterized DUF497 family protein